jgi:hypothetical protein
MKVSKQLRPREADNAESGSSSDFQLDPLPSRSSVKTALVEETIMMSCFAVFPDGAATPAAVFADLEDAMDWGLERYGGDAFGIRYLEMAQVETAERRGAPGPA